MDVCSADFYSQDTTYVITAEIDGEIYEVAKHVPDEELEGELQHLTRRHEFKNVTRFYIKEMEEVGHDSFS
jgi:hypothetical protein